MNSQRESPERIFRRAKKFFGKNCGPEDYRTGYQLFKRAAALGYPRAHEGLGFVYDYGLGTRPNRRLAFEHYKAAAAARIPNAEYHVGVFYYQGIAVRKDFLSAVFWLRQAAKHGDTHGQISSGRVLPARTRGSERSQEGLRTRARICGTGRIGRPVFGRALLQPRRGYCR